MCCIFQYNLEGAKQVSLNDNNGFIELIFPSISDLTTVTPSLQLSEGASVLTPVNPEGPIDLSVITTYRIINGNLYKDYQVLAMHVKDVACIETFIIGRYRGVIDNVNRTIRLNYPVGEDITNLVASVTVNNGAELQTSTVYPIDFTEPVDFVIRYMDEIFVYSVSVMPTTFSPMAFLGEASSAR